MQDELKRYNTIGNEAGIAYFAKTVLSSNRIPMSTVQKLCALQNNIRLNFPAALAFFKYLGLVTEKDNQLIPTENGKELCGQPSFDNALCMVCLDNIISDGVIDMEAVHYDVIQDKYYIEKYGFAVSAALFRNILLQYKALHEKDGNLQINPQYERLFATQQKKAASKKTIEKLKQQLLNQELQGERAELYVLELERMRLSASPLRDKIKRISPIDVSAGYDIVSFIDANSTEYDCFIEVKSYVGNPHFFWSTNEIDMAKLYGNRYLIALVNDQQIYSSNYKPIFIRNPAECIINSDSWLMNPTSYMVIPTDSL